MRFFNTTGPVVVGEHYNIPPLSRVDLDGMLRLIRTRRYFVLHAPRQTGKTSVLLALQDMLNAGGEYRCVYGNVEIGQTAREDVGRGMRAILGELAGRASFVLGDEFLEGVRAEMLDSYGPDGALRQALSLWAAADPRPLVLLIDEIDALVGDTLLAVLRQLRAGYPMRPAAFPQSVVLCGVRDVHDYRIRSTDGKTVVAGGSAFNIKAKSLRLGDFSRAETLALAAQHTGDTGQAFAPGAVERLWTQSLGQPWLVNALAAEACFETVRGRDRSRAVTEADIIDAQEQLILRRETHLDQLADKLQEPRVRRVVEPLLSGGEADAEASARDIAYVRDLGLIARDAPVRIANPVYAEVVPRELAAYAQETLPQETAWYVNADNSLDVVKLLAAFQSFFREHSEHWIGRFAYREAGPQLLLQAFLQRIVNGGGRIEREYGLGRKLTDLLVIWPWGAGGGASEARKYVVECKILRGGLEKTVRDGIVQTEEYMTRCAAAEGHLVVFDRGDRDWADKVFHRVECAKRAPIHIWGM